MDLNALTELLRNQAKTGGKLVLDDTILTATDIESIRNLFLLNTDQYFTITGIAESDIPDPQNQKLIVKAGTASVFQQNVATSELLFTINSSGFVQILISSAMGDSWSFAQSFSDLTLFPFSSIAVSGSYFIYSSVDVSQFFPWSNQPAEGISVVTGLNFAARATPDIFSGSAELLREVLGGAAQLKMYGPFSPDATNPYPITSLTMPTGSATFSITDSLSLGNFSLVASINPPTGLLQDASLHFVADTEDLEFSIGITGGDPALTFGAGPKPGKTITADQILQLPGGDDFNQYIPSELSDVFKSVTLNRFMVVMTIPKQITYVSLDIGSVPGSTWKLIPDVLTLENFSLDVSYFDPFGSAKTAMIEIGANCQIFPNIFTGTFDFAMKVGDSGGKWEIEEISGNYYGSVTLYNLINGITGGAGSLPEVLNDISFFDFGLAASKSGENYTYALHGQCTAAFPVLDTKVLSTLVVIANYSADGYDIDLKGAILIGEQNFAIELALHKTGGTGGSSGSILSASWTAGGSGYLQFEDIASAFGFDPPEIPEDLDLALKSATFRYNFTNTTLVLEAESVNYGKAVFIAFKNQTTSKWQFFFELAVNATINLSNLPLINKVLSGDQTIQVEQIQVLIASTPLDPSKPADKAEIEQINKLIDQGYPTIPEQGLPHTVTLAARFNFGGLVIPLSIGAGGSATGGGNGDSVTAEQEQTGTLVGASTGTNGGTVPSPAEAADGTTWFTIQKNFGPVNFQKIGVNYKDGILWFLIDASLTASSLEISVIGLSVGSPLSDFSPQFNIEGLGIDYKNPTVTIGGSFVKLPPSPPVTLEFAGSATIQLEEFGISAVGSYVEFSGNTSLFVFASVHGPFGGPGFFFVTGFCGGFGYNSKLRIPGQDEVYQFPFVAAMSNPNVLGSNPGPTDVLEKIMGGEDPWVTPSAGDIWLSAGIQFTTYELINSTALLTAEFGSKFLLALIGLSSARFPMEGSTVYAYVELQLELLFDPGDGVISFTAVLSPNSYLLDRACHLTGGFAMFFWFDPGPYAGDFVLTLGGYSPYYSVPSHYPQEPRLGFNWALDSSVSISGGLYFALTPAAVMAGGSLDVRYHSGNLKAWFSAYADIIIWYNPFHFIADIGVSVGASYKVDLWLCSKTFSVELGADLTLWGPETGGKAHIHWWIISFTVDFGASRSSALDTQNWDQFSKVLPEPKNSVKIVPVTGLMPTPASPAASGTLLAYPGDEPATPWIVRKDNFQFTTNSAIPLSSLYIGSETTPVKTGDAINIKPMGRTGITAKKTLSILSKETGENVLDNTWGIEPVTGNTPVALWGTGSNTSLPGGDSLISGQLSGLRITVPSPVLGAGTGDINIKEDLQYDPLAPGQNPLRLGLNPEGPEPQASTETITDIEQIMTQTILDRRNSTFAAIQSLGLAGLTNGDLTELGRTAGALFADEPLLINA